MKFAVHLNSHITPEWRKQYITYDEMKSMLYVATEQAPSTETAEPDEIARYYAKFDEQFFQYCDKELAKINTFHSEKLAEAIRKFNSLRSELAEAKGENMVHGKEGFMPRTKILTRPEVPARKIRDLKLAFSEFYLSLILLQNYQTLNSVGFRKILKKHDKLLNVEIGMHWRLEHVEVSHFYTNKDIDRLIHDTETTFTHELEGGDRQRAMKRLRVPPLGEYQSPWTTFKVGLFSGSFIILLIAVVLSATFNESRSGDWRIATRLYRGPLLIVLFLFLMGVNVYGWRSSGVNHVLIFELDPRNHLSEQHIMECAAVFGVLWALSVLCFLYSNALSMPAYVNPLVLNFVMFFFLLNPIGCWHKDARLWVLRVLGRIITAPILHVEFADFWLADQLTSLVPAFQDLQYTVCFYIINGPFVEIDAAEDATKCVDNAYMLRPFVACLPTWFRLAQCLRRYQDSKEKFPHLANAAKYATTFFVILFSFLHRKHAKDYSISSDNPYFYLWVLSLVVSSCYSYTWDIRMDWGLFDNKPGDNKFLREEIVYSSKGYYYFAIVEDFILRFGWVLSMSLTEIGYLHSELIVSILSPMEVFRRFVWNFFRLENEHLNNCGKFRATRDISVAPIDSSDQALIVRMMDAEILVTNRHKKKHRDATVGTRKREHLTLLLPDVSQADSFDDS